MPRLRTFRKRCAISTRRTRSTAALMDARPIGESLPTPGSTSRQRGASWSKSATAKRLLSEEFLRMWAWLRPANGPILELEPAASALAAGRRNKQRDKKGVGKGTKLSYL